MKVMTMRSQIREIAGEYRRVKTWDKEGTDWRSPQFRATYERLLKLDVETATLDDVAQAMGDTRWIDINLTCDECGRVAEAIVRFEPRLRGAGLGVHICQTCLQKAIGLIEADHRDLTRQEKLELLAALEAEGALKRRTREAMIDGGEEA